MINKSQSLSFQMYLKVILKVGWLMNETLWIKLKAKIEISLDKIFQGVHTPMLEVKM